MANLAWIKGMESPNPQGGKRHRDQTADVMVKRILKGVYPYPKLSKRIAKLPDTQYVEVWVRLITLTVPKPQPNTLTDEELAALRTMAENKVKNDVQAKKTG